MGRMNGIEAAIMVMADSVIAQMSTSAMLYVKPAQVPIRGMYAVFTTQATPALVLSKCLEDHERMRSDLQAA